MANINFVPDDYIQKKESSRSNWMYLFLCIVMIGALGGTFGIIKMRQKSLNREAQAIAQRMIKANEDIARFEQLQVKRKEMLQTALTAVKLLEVVPRSVIIASITNNLPEGTSLVNVNLGEKASKDLMSMRGGTYATAGQSNVATKNVMATVIEIEGVSPSDSQVAELIANLDKCELFNRVDLEYTKEFKGDNNVTSSIRLFKISTSLKDGVEVTKDFIANVRYNGV